MKKGEELSMPSPAAISGIFGGSSWGKEYITYVARSKAQQIPFPRRKTIAHQSRRIVQAKRQKEHKLPTQA